MDVAKKKLEVPAWVCWLAIGLGSIALAVQCMVDIYQNVSADMDRAAFLAQVWQMSLPTGFTLVFAAMSGSLLRVGTWKCIIAGILLFGLVVAYMAYTATNSMDFLANQTVARTQAQMSKATADKDIAGIKNQIALQERKDKHDNLWRTYIAAKSATEKDKILAEIKAAGQEDIGLQKTDVEVVQIGVGATAQRILGWRPEAIQEAKAIAYPILVMIGKMLGITLGFAFRPARAAERWEANPPARFSDPVFPENTRKFSKEEARQDIISMIHAGATVQSGRELSRRWGVRDGTVSKWLGDFRSEGLIKREANGNARAVIAAPHHNGNGRVMGSA